MKKLFALLAVIGFMNLTTFAQEQAEATTATDTTKKEQVETTEADAPQETIPTASAEIEEKGMHQVLKEKFIEGGAGFMAAIFLCLIVGLAVAIERIIYLNLATTNTGKLLKKVEDALYSGGKESALEICRNTPGPVASIFYQGISRYDEGVEIVEKTIESYGGVQMSSMEKGLTWLSLFISLAPMLGFLGTVLGMIQAFDAIAIAGDMSPIVVAGGIKVALITTVGGLIVAMILQVFYNYLLTKIDALTTDMEDSSISLVDIIVKYNAKK
jgi:biopolymer transport protein ExbB